jgi:acetyl-CoA acetyltransferase
VTTQFFGMKIRRYMSLVEISPHVLALVAEKAYANSALTDRAWRREPVTAEAILASGMISDPLTKLMFCSPTEGAVALVLASEKKAKTLGRAGIRIAGAGVRTRVAGSFEVFSPALDRARGAQRGTAGARQTEKSIRFAYSQVYGAPGLSAVCILGRG